MNRKVTDSEIDLIEAHLKKSGVTDINTLSELIDHLVALTESELTTEPDFTAAFNRALKKFDQKDFIEISLNRESFYAHPQFLNKTFFLVFALASVSVFLIGVYLRAHLLPGRVIFQITGAASFGYVYLPLLLLYWLTEHANKAKFVTGFMVLFTAFHAFIGWYLNWPIAWLFGIMALLFAGYFSTVYLVYPKFKS
jgi:hypothetical protein